MKSFIMIVFISLTAILAFGQEGTEEKSCMDCHEDLMAHKVRHEVALDDCENCHSSISEGHPAEGVKGFELADQLPDLCFYCHEEHSKKNLHVPVEEGECMICHSPHSSDNRALLVSSPESAVCAECHDMEMTEKPVQHKPVADGACASCHNPHQSDLSSLLKADKTMVCNSCHTSVMMENRLKNLHAPFEDDCGNCHETHSANEQKLLLAKVPMLCFECHDMKEAIESAPFVHQVMKDEKSCMNCHSGHASNEGMFLIQKEKDLCMSCHNKTIKTEHKTLANISRSLKKGNFIHAPIEEEGCIICHHPHLSDYPSLLVGAFPSGTYTPASEDQFELCFMCHDAEMLSVEKSTSATGFRNGDQNLHYVHIQGEKGRNCKVCHDVHGSKNEHLINDQYGFGSWNMPLGYTVLENGGSCNTGCHARKDYIR